MEVGIGYSDNPDTNTAGIQSIKMAINQAKRADLCDMVLMFSTARHDQSLLREAVISVIGVSVPIYGGGAVGIITNEYFGYAGDQIAVVCIWLDGVGCKVLTDGGLKESEKDTGIRLGQRLAELGTKPDSPVMLFYDALDCEKGVRMLMATWLLEGIEKGLGFFPDLTGAGLMGDHACTPTSQWTGDGISEHNAITLAFSGDIRINSVIMHGCRPATGYYTVTKAHGPVILEINGKPAIQFIDELLESAISPEEYPFFLIFGINHGERWGEYDEDYYASRLCLGIDKERNGIVMFEPDMVEGTEFQLMYKALDLNYIKPKIDKMFDDLDGRKPVFAVYIDCAGRCSGYGGMDMEDAVVIQKTVAGRVPVLGLYTGVEIASIGGRPRGLDWTGVFCLFSQSKDGSEDNSGQVTSKPVWDMGTTCPHSKEIPVEAMTRRAEQNMAKILALNINSTTIRHELEQKRRGFSLLAELAVSLRQNVSYESIFIPTAKRINAALHMQRTVVLLKNADGLYTAEVLQGYSTQEKARFAGKRMEMPAAFLDPDYPVLVTGADIPDQFHDLRELFGLPYFISSPVILKNDVIAILITGRLVETPPYLVRLSRNDAETVQAITALLASVVSGQRLAAAEERNRIMVDAMPMCCTFWDENGNQTACNRETLSLFGLPSKKDYLDLFHKLSPEYQPDGRYSVETSKRLVREAFVTGGAKFKWTHQTLDGELIPTEITLIRVPKGENYTVVGYIHDLRDQEAAQNKMNEAREIADRYIKAKNDFIASVSHEIRTPMNAIVAMARIAGENKNLDKAQKNIIEQGIRSTKLLMSAVETILDFSKLDSGQFTLEIGELSVRDLVEGIGEIVRGNAEEKSLSLHISIDPDVPESLIGDSTRLQQALLNIVMNAIKFTDKGSVEVHVFSDKPTPDGKALLTFEVRDTGVGINEEKIAELFKPMFVGDTAYTRKYGGIGMGLSISNSLTMLMGGEIKCESRLGEGSVFQMIVPLTMPEEKSFTVKETAETSNWNVLRGLRILVAEDNSINQMVMEELLTSVGIEVTLAENGIQALEILRKETFDVVLMDIQMPEMDGLTATAQIRTNHSYDDLPILAMTANSGVEHMEESMRAGMNDHLTKPVDVKHLYTALIKWNKRDQLR